MKNHNAFLTFSAIFLFFVSCEKRDFNLLGKDEMVDVLTEMYITEGTLDALYIRNDQKKLIYYNSLFEKYGTTRTDFEKSAAWYAKKPKKMELIYEDVLAKLKILTNDVNNYVYHPDYPASLIQTDVIDTINIWPLNQAYSVHPDSANTEEPELAFCLNDSNFFAAEDKFILYFLQKTELMDSSLKTHIRFFVQYSDSTIDSLKHSVYKDGKRRRFTFKVNNPDRLRPIAVYGNLFKYDSLLGTPNRTFDSISLKRIYNSTKFPMQDSIRKKLNVSTVPVPSAIRNQPKERRIPLQHLKKEKITGNGKN